jgi:hypothetical protein
MDDTSIDFFSHRKYNFFLIDISATKASLKTGIPTHEKAQCKKFGARRQQVFFTGRRKMSVLKKYHKYILSEK